jgi:hypothetical protein
MSISVLMKHRYASSGEQTIGLPRTLKDVLTSTGQPVFRPECLQEGVVARVRVAMHGLHSLNNRRA